MTSEDGGKATDVAGSQETLRIARNSQDPQETYKIACLPEYPKIKQCCQYLHLDSQTHPPLIPILVRINVYCLKSPISWSFVMAALETNVLFSLFKKQKQNRTEHCRMESPRELEKLPKIPMLLCTSWTWHITNYQPPFCSKNKAIHPGSFLTFSFGFLDAWTTWKGFRGHKHVYQLEIVLLVQRSFSHLDLIRFNIDLVTSLAWTWD